MNSYLRKTKNEKMTHKVQTADDKKLQNSKLWKPYSLQEIINDQHLKKLTWISLQRRVIPSTSIISLYGSAHIRFKKFSCIIAAIKQQKSLQDKSHIYDQGPLSLKVFTYKNQLNLSNAIPLL